jgi:hypothetical protein
MSSHTSEQVKTCIEIALRCVEVDREKRPTIAEIVDELSKVDTAESSPTGQVYILDRLYARNLHSMKTSFPLMINANSFTFVILFLLSSLPTLWSTTITFHSFIRTISRQKFYGLLLRFVNRLEAYRHGYNIHHVIVGIISCVNMLVKI